MTHIDIVDYYIDGDAIVFIIPVSINEIEAQTAANQFHARLHDIPSIRYGTADIDHQKESVVLRASFQRGFLQDIDNFYLRRIQAELREPFNLEPRNGTKFRRVDKPDRRQRRPYRA